MVSTEDQVLNYFVSLSRVLNSFIPDHKADFLLLFQVRHKDFKPKQGMFFFVGMSVQPTLHFIPLTNTSNGFTH